MMTLRNMPYMAECHPSEHAHKMLRLQRPPNSSACACRTIHACDMKQRAGDALNLFKLNWYWVAVAPVRIAIELHSNNACFSGERITTTQVYMKIALSCFTLAFIVFLCVNLIILNFFLLRRFRSRRWFCVYHLQWSARANAAIRTLTNIVQSRKKW